MSIENNEKGDKLCNFKSKLLETRAFKGTLNITKKSCTSGGNHTKKILLLSDQSLYILI